MQRLDEKTWIDKKILEVFDCVQRGKRLKNAYHVPGIMPYVSSTANNNGVDDYIEATPGTRVFADCISLANSGSVGTAFYEPFHYVASDHVTSLKKEGLTAQQYLFLASVVEKQGVNFNFNREINDARISNMRVLLPSNDDGEPDYEFMESYASEMRGGLLMRYKNYVAERLSELEHKNIPALDEKEWAEFMMNDIFIIGHGFYNKKPPMYEDGEIPFVGASDSHNGVTGFTHMADIERCSKTGNPPNEAIERKLFDGPCIAVTNNGSVGYAYYHASTFTCTHDVNPLWLRNGKLSEPLAHFLGSCIHMQAVCFEYARKWRPKRMVHSRIMLPVNDAGEPDFDYMEQYSKNMMLRKYQQYLAFLDEKK